MASKDADYDNDGSQGPSVIADHSSLSPEAEHGLMALGAVGKSCALVRDTELISYRWTHYSRTPGVSILETAQTPPS